MYRSTAVQISQFLFLKANSLKVNILKTDRQIYTNLCVILSLNMLVVVHKYFNVVTFFSQ